MSDVQVFINYRRRDTRHVAGRLRDQIVARFGAASVFVDVESILPGQDYVTAIDGAVSQCDYMLVLIGEEWLAPDDSGVRRIDDPNDRLRLEIEAGLRHQTMVIPVLVDAARMPRSRELPETLVPLSRHQAVHLRHDSFPGDLRYLLDAIDPMEAQQPPTQPGTGATADHTAADPGSEGSEIESRSASTARWLTVGVLVAVVLAQLLLLPGTADAVLASRPFASGAWAVLVWLLPAVPVAAAALLLATRASAGAALGCVIAAVLWIWTTASFVLAGGYGGAGTHLLLMALLVAAGAGVLAATPALRARPAPNGAGYVAAALVLLVAAVGFRALSRVVSSVVVGDAPPDNLVSSGGFLPALVIPLLVAAAAALLKVSRPQAVALLTAAWLQVAYPLVVRVVLFPDAIDQGGQSTTAFAVDSVVYLVGSYCIVLAVRAGQRPTLRTPA